MIQPNCRVQFTAEDVAFIITMLGHGAGDTDCLTRLLADEDTRDLILDDERLFRALQEHRGCLRVSARLYFYVLVRQVLRRTGITERPVTDYVAEVLTEFSETEQTRLRVPGQSATLDYFFEMLAALQTADEPTRFLIRTHIGNQSLFMSGIFPDRIRARAERRGFPDLSYYESLGQANFRAASDHRLARKYELSNVFTTLSERFHETRLALNDLSERLVSVGEPEVPVGVLLRAGLN
ncbi:MAG: hypothetical protein EBS05_15925 [Proteobacteria bacterium]|nr:hypothetical protein [Pseudomonadota bacterium]